jgi:hypothetical protein
MSRIAYVPFSAILAALALSSVVAAQSRPDSPAGHSMPSPAAPIVIPLPDGGALTFDPHGTYSASAPNLQLGGSLNGAASNSSAANPPSPPNQSPGFQPVDLEALDLAIRQSNAARCLTQMGFVCEPAPPALAGRLHERSTRVDTSWLINQIGRELDGDAPLPGIQINANPDPGITGIPTWFWVNRASYAGQTFSASNAIAVPWMLYWDEIVHHHDVSTSPCENDPSRQCTTTHDWDETVTHHEEHQDLITVTVDFSPVQFAWDFGDDTQNRRSESHAAFGDVKGMGQPYVDPHTPSPVAHNYSESSLNFFDQGGFPIQLSVTWSATATWHFTSDLGDNASGTRTFGARVGQYSARHQVRESQPVLIATNP